MNVCIVCTEFFNIRCGLSTGVDGVWSTTHGCFLKIIVGYIIYSIYCVQILNNFNKNLFFIDTSVQDNKSN